MPLLDSIIVHPQDLANVLDQLKAKQHTGPVKIIDTNGTLTVRDINEAFIVNVQRIIPEDNDG